MIFIKNQKMNSKTLLIILTLLLPLSAISGNAFRDIQVVNLKCEYHNNPLGIDVEKPRFSWQISSHEHDVLQTAYEIRVAGSPENLNTKNKLIWTSGKVNSAKSVNVEYGGQTLKSMQCGYWQVRIWDNKGHVSSWSEPAYWEMGILEPETWSASWITRGSEEKTDSTPPAHYYRNEFSIDKKITSARAYVTSLGLYELYINGEKVGDQLFTPGWTSYNKRLQYQTYDVRSMIQQHNAIGVILGDGWYRGNIGWKKQRNYYGDQIALLVQLVINYTDGTTKKIVSNKNWKVSTGPIRKSDIYNGEFYDARLEKEGRFKTGFDDSAWEPATVLNHPKDILIAPQGVTVRAMEEIIPIESFITPKGEMVVDMGQNMVGKVRIKLKGKKGDKVVLKFAEVLDKNGNFYTANLRSAKCTDTYIFKGEDEEIYEPKFTFHGFRYLKLEGLNKLPPLEDITGVVIYSDMEPTGSFSCSNPLINQLQHNIKWGQKGNFLDVPTDCPQRDERLGWTGDAQVFIPTAAFNFDVAAFFTKWTKDITADQNEDGKVPHVIPDVLKGAGGSTAWGDAAIIVPWNTYLVYNDKRILEEQYESMKKWLGFMQKNAGDDYLWTDGHHFGDWLAFSSTSPGYPGATTVKDLIATAYYAYSSGLLSKIATIVGEQADAKKLETLSGNIKKAFVNEFVTSSGRLVSHTQTAYCLALSFDLLPDELISNAAQYLAKDVSKMGHLTTGFVGTPLLCKTLSDHGYEDLAYMLLNRKKYPSWLYPVTQGATTIWERWDGQKPDGTFQNDGMNSFNHYAYGAIGEWLYTYVAGINIDVENPGYKHILFHPHPGGGLTNANAEIESVYGLIKSAWEIKDGKFIYEITIPHNSTGTITLPNAKGKQITINSEPITNELKEAVSESGDHLVFKLGSGNYWFEY